MSNLSEMRNLGPKTKSQLTEIGISDPDEIRSLGAVKVYQRLRFAFGQTISLNMLYALEGAITDVDWRAISPERKDELQKLVSEG